MGMISIRELNANVSKAIAAVAAGETFDITRNGKVVAELRPKGNSRLDDPDRRAAYERLLAGLAEGLPGMSGAASYEERTER